MPKKHLCLKVLWQVQAAEAGRSDTDAANNRTIRKKIPHKSGRAGNIFKAGSYSRSKLALQENIFKVGLLMDGEWHKATP